MRMTECERCLASKKTATIIDMLNPDTGLTWCYGKTIEECRAEYPDVEEMTVDEFCEWKTAQQRTPITWEPTTAENYDDMLNVLPPAAFTGSAFLVGEPWDHDAGNGLPRFTAFRRSGNTYEVSSRPMTRPEFREEAIQ